MINDDLFGNTELLRAINALPYRPGGRISSRKPRIFAEKGIATLKFRLEEINGTITLIQTSPRGAPAETHPFTPRSEIELSVPHVRVRSTVQADSWQDRRGFGTGQLANVEQERDRVLAEHSRRIEATIEWQRMGAIKGAVLDADGSTLVDLFATFGVTQQTTDCELDVTTTHLPNKLVAARRLSEAALGDDAGIVSGWVAFCSASFIDKARAHPSVEAYAAGWAGAAVMRDDVRAGGLVLGGVELIEIPDGAGKTWIATDEAFLVPEGVDGLFMTNYAPADYTDTVNKEGLPKYSRAEPLPFNRGWQIESQSNPLSICTRPRAVVKLTA
ncbi:MAG: major capsid protein [Burkholderiaceae bacterium]|jgi:hypothetical protein|nr:major capsid protein [Burkholderiaceae bacterium]